MMFTAPFRRTLAVVSLSAFGSLLAFSAGAKVGAKLDHGARSVMIARMPVPTVATPDEELPPVTEVARK